MNKNLKTLLKRRQFVRDQVNKSKYSVTETVDRLANKLFLDKMTIWRDLRDSKSKTS